MMKELLSMMGGQEEMGGEMANEMAGSGGD
jgi:hypothetical protein